MSMTETFHDATATSADATNKPRKPGFVDWTPIQYDMRDTWFPVAHAPHVTDRPIRRMVHSQAYYLWREQGVVFASEFPPGCQEASRHMASEFTGGTGFYPVVERHGYVWAWYGNPDQATHDLLPHIPFLKRDGSHIPNYMRTVVRFDACSALSVENLLDLTHADFLHGELVGGEGEAKSDEVTFEFTSETLTRTRWVTGKPVSPVMRWVAGVRAQYQDFRSTLHVHLRSNLCISYPRFEPGADVPNVQPFVPVGKHRSRVDQIFNLHQAKTPFRQLMPQMAKVVGPQDNSVMRPQNPRYLYAQDRRDMHSRFDAPGARYRFLMQQLWERQKQGDYSYGHDADPGGDITKILGMDKALD